MTLVCHNQRLNGSLFTRWTESSLSDYLWIKHLSLGGGGRAGAILFSQVNFFYALPQFPAEKNVILPLVWPKIVMSLPTLKDMTGVIKRDQFLPYDEGRRQCDIQEQVSKDHLTHWQNIEHEQSWCCRKILHYRLCSCPSWPVNTVGEHYEA